MSFSKMYQQKSVSADKAALAVKSGDWVDYGHFLTTPLNFDAALSRRAGQVRDVKIRTAGFLGLPATAVSDPKQESFIYNSGFFMAGDRGLHDKGLAYHIPLIYYEFPGFSERHLRSDVGVFRAAPMDENGFFNYGISNDCIRRMIDAA
ncbi:MAG: 4-hydroxybutyrate CoA-transferase, partial [Deltaproteobacteria bacterium]|nr:4-hydroxybutyrate CoA-transferase [Deltaproteobacteria bacterium]